MISGGKERVLVMVLLDTPFPLTDACMLFPRSVYNDVMC